MRRPRETASQLHMAIGRTHGRSRHAQQHRAHSLLVERGIQLSRPQVYRVVHQRPERISLQMMAALCDILGCGVEDLVTVTASDVRRRKASSSSRPRRHPTSSNSTRRCGLAEPGCWAMTISPNRRSTKRGRPLVTDGRFRCSRCQRMANQRRASWPGEDLCSSCFYTAMRNRGVCPSAVTTACFPAWPSTAIGGRSACRARESPVDFTCRRCGTEGDLYRRGTCARCALRDDLTVMMIDGAHDPDAMTPSSMRCVGSTGPPASSPGNSPPGSKNCWPAWPAGTSR